MPEPFDQASNPFSIPSPVDVTQSAVPSLDPAKLQSDRLLAGDMVPEDGVGEGGVPAFTRDGIEYL
jgi:hypothetical protein